MPGTDDYLLDLSADPGAAAAGGRAEAAFDRVWRFDFTAPGFCLLDLGPGVSSHALRSLMLALKERLSDVLLRRTGRRFVYRGMGRFDQQETTRFHLDGAPEQSLLVLGYEPSKVRSRLSLADYTRCAFDLGIGPRQFLHDFNPMFRRGEELLARYATGLPEAAEGHSRVLLVNNSSLPFSAARTNPLGVMHRAEILNPTTSERRIVNSVLLATAEGAGTDDVGRERQEDFVNTDRISEKVYD